MATDMSRTIRDCIVVLTLSDENTSMSATRLDQDTAADFVSDESLSSINTPSPRIGSPMPLADDSQQDLDVFPLNALLMVVNGLG
jgi:hypothetical protein